MVSSTLWFLFERAGYSLITLVANVLLLLVVILFFWAKSASLLNRCAFLLHWFGFLGFPLLDASIVVMLLLLMVIQTSSSPSWSGSFWGFCYKDCWCSSSVDQLCIGLCKWYCFGERCEAFCTGLVIFAIELTWICNVWSKQFLVHASILCQRVFCLVQYFQCISFDKATQQTILTIYALTYKCMVELGKLMCWCGLYASRKCPPIKSLELLDRKYFDLLHFNGWVTWVFRWTNWITGGWTLLVWNADTK